MTQKNEKVPFVTRAGIVPGSQVALTELLFNLALQELHFGRLAVDQQHVPRLRHSNELHDALCVCMRAEGHVLHLQLHIQLASTGEGFVSTHAHTQAFTEPTHTHTHTAH